MGLLQQDDFRHLLAGRQIGVERETLRANLRGEISQQPHPPGLGSALTHPLITTDFSEALLELVTEPHERVEAVVHQLDQIHQYVYQQLDEEILWASSMPCLVDGDDSIPIANYGHSNVGMMKTVYRRGLSWRYGRMLQAIAGVHFNFSLPEAFFAALREEDGSSEDLKDCMTTEYFGMIRNLQQISWLVPYLFGASPAICESFLLGEENDTLMMMGGGTRFQPFATSLRMGDIGYQNSQSGKRRINVCYNTLDSYSKTLRQAMNAVHPAYREIGVKVNGEYRQLNDKVLQIENEYYASVRPKAVPSPKEKPLTALHKKGVRYLELRSLDLNSLSPLGITLTQLRFLEAMMIYSLLVESPMLSGEEIVDIEHNLLAVAHGGRDTEMILKRHGRNVQLEDWAGEVLEHIRPVCELLDQGTGDTAYVDAWKRQQRKVDEPAATPSAKVLDTIVSNKETFFDYAMRQSLEHKAYFDSRQLSEAKRREFETMATQSVSDQAAREAADDVDFDAFLDAYFTSD